MVSGEWEAKNALSRSLLPGPEQAHDVGPRSEFLPQLQHAAVSKRAPAFDEAVPAEPLDLALGNDVKGEKQLPAQARQFAPWNARVRLLHPFGGRRHLGLFVQEMAPADAKKATTAGCWIRAAINVRGKFTGILSRSGIGWDGKLERIEWDAARGGARLRELAFASRHFGAERHPILRFEGERAQ